MDDAMCVEGIGEDVGDFESAARAALSAEGVSIGSDADPIREDAVDAVTRIAGLNLDGVSLCVLHAVLYGDGGLLNCAWKCRRCSGGCTTTRMARQSPRQL